MARLTKTDVRRAAMDLLARREHGYQELIQKLKKRFSKPWIELPPAEHGSGDLVPDLPVDGHTDDTAPVIDLMSLIQQEVDKLNQEGLQSDSRLAEAFVRSRANRGQGPIKIKAELRARGVADTEIEAALSLCEVDWYSLAQQVAARKFGDQILDIKLRAKRQRFLQQRGFSFDHINEV